MRKWLIRILVFLVIPAICVFAYIFGRQYLEWREHQAWLATISTSASPNVTVLRDSIYIPYLDSKRTVHVYLPPDYDSTDKRYPVMYFMDGEALFDQVENEATEWRADEVMDSIAAAGGQTAILIGIQQSAVSRDDEYTPFPGPDYPDAHGDQFAEWLAYDFKEWVDDHYRTMPGAEYTGVGGCSRSAMMAYYALMTYPEVFGKGFIFSPSIWVDRERLMNLPDNVRDWTDKRVYVCIGDLEGGPMPGDSKAISAAMVTAGLNPDQLLYERIPELGHWHQTWQTAWPRAYDFLME